MSTKFSSLIAIGSAIVICVSFLASMYFLFNIDAFAALAQKSVNISIYWETVSQTQWYVLWLITFAYLSFGLVGLYFLRRAFSNFAKGEFFNLRNSQDLRRFSILLFMQAAARPLHHVLMGLLLSMNHPSGEKRLAISFGSLELQLIALAMIMWVVSSLLVTASHYEKENKQFI